MEKNNNINEEMEMEWVLEIYCIHSNYLIQYSNNDENNTNIEHYFTNCDCTHIKNNNNEECYYNLFYKEENLRKLNKEELKMKEMDKLKKEIEEEKIKLEKELKKSNQNEEIMKNVIKEIYYNPFYSRSELEPFLIKE